ncbi:MAG: hypothetical protein KBG28_07900 [Kofleriaceae bacterium]|jgi:hypothetical protein|nr:hypothetical protein [Kofleriaceae bacterium]MBP6837017.1 hypothetical protein [Kofleriaceae bacterium]MBP9203867.1 hypothetical protein [Kofleriaceae bacterium]
MAKKQTRRSISVSRGTYERLKAFCETNNISMSQFVETRVGDFLGEGAGGVVTLSAPPPRASSPTREAPRQAAPARTVPAAAPRASTPAPAQAAAAPAPAPVAKVVPMTSAAARYAVEPPPPVISKREEQPAPAPAMKTADQIFTF